MYIIAVWMGLESKYSTRSSNRVDFFTFDSSGHDCSNHSIFTARFSLQCSARGGVAVEGTSCMHGTNVEISITFSDPYQKCLRKP